MDGMGVGDGMSGRDLDICLGKTTPVGHSKWWWKVRESPPKSPNKNLVKYKYL